MSGTMKQAHDKVRKQLLATASVAALIAAVWSPAIAADGDRPLFWIEFGSQYERLSGATDVFAPPFVASWPGSDFTSPAEIENMLVYSYGADGKISFQPDNSDWTFTASVRYGRASASRHVHQQKALPAFNLAPNFPTFTQNYPQFAQYYVPLEKFAETRSSTKETHAIVDFQAGKDVGVGMFGRGSTSTLSAGLRFVQFDTRSDGSIYARPDVQIGYHNLGPFQLPLKYFYDYSANEHAQRKFEGIGPSIAWNASVPLIGGTGDSAVTLDWGVNAALLFGRQKTSLHHKTVKSQYIPHYFVYPHLPNSGYHIVYQTDKPDRRSRSVTAPNLGGFAGFSYRYSDAKISLGYRADFFLNAVDAGWDARKSQTRGFYGPFASISIALGD